MRIGIIGSGKIGATAAKLLTRAGGRAGARRGVTGLTVAPRASS